MKKRYFIIILIAGLTSMFLNSCTDEEPIDYSPRGDFNAAEINSVNGITFRFTDLSTNIPYQWYWTFEGGSPATSTERNPIITYDYPGMYNVTLTVTNDDGIDEVQFIDYVNIIEFNNTLFTDMDITINGITKTAAPDTYVQFAQLDDQYFSYYAEVYGLTTDGTIVGEELFWDETVDITYYDTYNLILDSDFIFLYINNSSNYDYYPIYVNWDTDYETEDNVLIPNDQYTYELGYYFAFNNMEIRAYLEDSYTEYDSWIIDPPGGDNQYMELVYKKSTQGKSAREISKSKTKPGMLNKANEVRTKSVLKPNAKNVGPSNKK